MSTDSSANGHRLKTISTLDNPGGRAPRYPKGLGHFGVLDGQNVIKSLRNAMICIEKMKNELCKNEMHKLT